MMFATFRVGGSDGITGWRTSATDSCEYPMCSVWKMMWLRYTEHLQHAITLLKTSRNLICVWQKEAGTAATYEGWEGLPFDSVTFMAAKWWPSGYVAQYLFFYTLLVINDDKLTCMRCRCYYRPRHRHKVQFRGTDFHSDAVKWDIILNNSNWWKCWFSFRFSFFGT